MESFSLRQRYRSTLLWAREFVWEPTDDPDVLYDRATAVLTMIGYRPIGGSWWLFQTSEDDHSPNISYWSACLERIPGSEAGWRSGLDSNSPA
jgi:hypothetical protein